MACAKRIVGAWVVLVAGAGLGATAPIPVERAPVGPMGRTLEQTVTVGEREFTVCVGLKNSDFTGYYLTVGLQSQIEISFTDEHGVAVRPGRTTLPTSPPPPPPSASPGAYFVLEGHSRIETCRSFEYGSFSADRLRIRSSFRSWLRRQDELPETVQRTAVNERVIGRPLYQDEPLTSNLCVLSLRSRRARCHRIDYGASF